MLASCICVALESKNWPHSCRTSDSCNFILANASQANLEFHLMARSMDEIAVFRYAEVKASQTVTSQSLIDRRPPLHRLRKSPRQCFYVGPQMNRSQNFCSDADA